MTDKTTKAVTRARNAALKQAAGIQKRLDAAVKALGNPEAHDSEPRWEKRKLATLVKLSKLQDKLDDLVVALQ